MWVGLAGEEFGRALAGARGAFTPVQAAVVEEELEQGQVVGAEVAAKGEVVPQPTVDVLDEGTGPDGALGELLDGLVEVVETPAELLAEFGLALPAAGVSVTEMLQTQQRAACVDGDVPALLLVAVREAAVDDHDGDREERRQRGQPAEL